MKAKIWKLLSLTIIIIFALPMVHMVYAQGPTLSAGIGCGPAGSIQEVAAGFFPSGDSVTINWGSTELYTITVTTLGEALGSFIVPDTPPGVYTVTAIDDDTGVSCTEAFNVTLPSITLDPSLGSAGTVVTVNGAGFPVILAPGTPYSDVLVNCGVPVSISWGSTVVENTNSSGNSELDCAFTVPSNASPGVYTVAVMDGQSCGSCTAMFTITGAPSIILDPTQGSSGSMLSFSLSGFPPKDDVMVEFESPTNPVTITNNTDSNGMLHDSLTVPKVALGSYTVSATDSQGNTASAQFDVIASLSPVLTLDPTEGSVGTTVVCKLTGFLPIVTVGITFGSKEFLDILHVEGVTDENGFGSVSFTIPAVGAGSNYTVLAIDERGNSATASFYVTGVPPNLTLNPAQAPAGSTIDLAVSNFPPDQYVVVQCQNQKGTLELTTDKNGFAQTTFPAFQQPGTYNITAIDSIADVATATLSVLRSATSTTIVRDNSAIADESATTGIRVTVSGSSLPNGAQVTVNSTDYGNTQPWGTGTPPVDAKIFYDVSAYLSNGSFSSNVNAVVSISDSNLTNTDVIEYYDGNNWVSAATTYVASNTLSCTVPAEALNGTPFAVCGSFAASSIAWVFILVFVVILVAIIVCFTSLTIALKRKRARHEKQKS